VQLTAAAQSANLVLPRDRTCATGMFALSARVGQGNRFPARLHIAPKPLHSSLPTLDKLFFARLFWISTPTRSMDSSYLFPTRALVTVPVPVHRHARTLSLHDNILQAYLPYFTANHFRNEPDVDLILDGWLRSHPASFEPSNRHPLRERDFRNAFYLIIDCIDEAEECGEHPIGVSKRILSVLEEEWEDDLRFGSGREGSKAQRLFRALAEVSNAARSTAIGNLLRAFFLGWLHELAEEDAVILAGWCSGVVKSSMDGRDKEDCLRAVAALRPDLIAEMNRRGASWLPLQAVNGPARNWPRRRRSAGRLWWDQENDERIWRLLEDQEYLDRDADRRRRKVDLRFNPSEYNRWPRRALRMRSSRSLDDRTLRRSRSPLPRLMDREDSERYLMDELIGSASQRLRSRNRYDVKGGIMDFIDFDDGR
jgi:hypothetical protein